MTKHRKATLEQTRIHNTRLVLKTIYDSDETSRAEIARVTKLTRPTVSDVVSRLIEDGLVSEVGFGESTGGKMPVLLSVKEDARNVIGIDLAGNKFRGAVVNMRGKILHKASSPIESVNGVALLDGVYDLLESLITQAGSPLLGIGVATPGLVDTQEGLVCKAVNLGWEDIPLRNLLANRFQVPIYIGNDSHAAALAEYMLGDKKTSSNLVVVKVGQGIGAGIVINGDLYYGDGFGAGEIGHIVISDHGVQCTCGNYGCLEAIASTRAILQKARGTDSQGPNSTLTERNELNWESLVEAFEAGDRAIRSIVVEAGKHLGITIANLIGCFNIHQILISGRVSAFGNVYLEAVKAEARRRVLPSMSATTNVDFATLDREIGILGSSAMVLKHELGII